MRLLVVRHGETDWNVERKMQGHVDIELNSNGIRQANALRDNLEKQNYNIDLIISSPLKRAKKTAEIISNGKIKIIYSDKIVERGFGELEGAKIEKSKEATINDLYDINYHGSIKGLESLSDLCERTSEFLNEVKEKYNDKNVMIVTHGGTIRAINAYFVRNSGKWKIAFNWSKKL